MAGDTVTVFFPVSFSRMFSRIDGQEAASEASAVREWLLRGSECVRGKLEKKHMAGYWIENRMQSKQRTEG